MSRVGLWSTGKQRHLESPEAASAAPSAAAADAVGDLLVVLRQ